MPPAVYYVSVLPFLTGLGFFMVLRGLYKRRETAPLVWNAITVALGFGGLSVSLYPHMMPHVVSPVTVEQAAASPSTLIFMFVVTGLLLPVILFYTTYTYRVFRGKVKAQEY